MLFSALFWIAVFLIIMRILTWVARNHPRFRNLAALIVETGAALAIWEALASTGALSSGFGGPSGPLVTHAVLFACIGGAAHFFASNTATSPHALYPPFIILGIAALVWLWMPFFRWPIGLGMLAIGCAVGWMKFRSVRRRPHAGSLHEPTTA